MTVNLYNDPDGDGVYSNLVATTTTNGAGYYIFDGLAAGAYVVRIPTPPLGYNQTGDPDDTKDNQTTSPIVLAPGDVFLNADFGYKPGAGTYGSIGDTVWVDSNRNNTQDGTGAAAEKGIPGVTVALIRDSNENGQWDANEPIIATDITDENGLYLFDGLPVATGAGTNDYLVWVNDTNNVTGGLAPVYDVRDNTSQGNPTTGLVTGLTISAVTNLTTTAVTNADFAYAPYGQASGEGMIGDTIYLDRDNSGLPGSGEGIEGVTVQLYASNGTTLIATTVTDENGRYYFGNLPAGTFVVKVDTSTLPGAGAGLTNTKDPDTSNPGNSQSTVALTAGQLTSTRTSATRARARSATWSGTM